MKYKVLKEFIRLKNWANTPIGECTIVRFLTTLSAIFVIDVLLLAIGLLF